MDDERRLRAIVREVPVVFVEPKGHYDVVCPAGEASARLAVKVNTRVHIETVASLLVQVRFGDIGLARVAKEPLVYLGQFVVARACARPVGQTCLSADKRG